MSQAVNADQTALNLLFTSLSADNEAEQAQIISLNAPTVAIRRRALELLKSHHSEDRSLLPKETTGRVNLFDGGHGTKIVFETEIGDRDELDTFELQEWIGRGTSSDLFTAKHNSADKRTFVVKVPRLMSAGKGLKSLSRELMMMELASHPNVVRGIRVGKLANDRPFLMMEHVSGNRLTSFLKFSSCRLEQVFDVLTQIAITIADLHRRGIVHCDLNPDNIIITRQPNCFRPILIDFGSSRYLNHVRRPHFAPTEGFTTGGKKKSLELRLPSESETAFLRDIRALAMMAFTFLKMNRNEQRLQKEYGYSVPREIESVYNDLILSRSAKDIPNADAVAERFANIASRMNACEFNEDKPSS